MTTVTTAPTSLGDDIDARTRRYLISMSIRTLCFLLMIVVPGWWKWVFLVGAVLLPYVAVVLANAVNVQSTGTIEQVDEQQPMLGPGDTPAIESWVVVADDETAAPHADSPADRPGNASGDEPDAADDQDRS